MRLALPCCLSVLLLLPLAGVTNSQDPDDLAVRSVVLFTTGVGYFEHVGRVEGDQSLRIDVEKGVLDDLLKTMVVSDSQGGVASSVRYVVDDSLQDQLSAFSVDLSAAPTMGELLQQLRGERVELHAAEVLKGSIIGLEVKPSQPQSGPAIEVEYINMLTADGLQSVPLSSVKRVRLTDEKLRGELEEALKALAEGRRDDKRQVTFQFSGEGERQVSVGFLRDAPVWKTTYRLRLGEGADKEEKPDAARLEGWAIVENTTDADWDGVRVALVSGSPTTFRMNLVNPYFAARPSLNLSIAGSPRPTTYARNSTITSVIPAVVDAGGGMGGMGGMAGGMGGGMGGGGFGGGGAFGGGGLDADSGGDGVADPFGGGGEVRGGYALPKDLAALDADANAFASAATGGQVGENFQYVVEDYVKLPRRQSALLPVLQIPLEASTLSIFSPQKSQSRLMLGVRLENKSTYHLAAGPIAVYADGAFAGETNIDHMRPDESRLISYAVDLAVEVKPLPIDSESLLINVAVDKGNLVLEYTDRRTFRYQFGNLGDKDRRVLVEHRKPEEDVWKVVAPEEASEETQNLLRFELDLPAAKNNDIQIVETKDRTVRSTLSLVDEATLRELIANPKTGAAERALMHEVLNLRKAVADEVASQATFSRKITSLESDQNRIRSNLRELDRNTPLYARYIKTLEAQEDSLQELRTAQRDSVEKQQMLKAKLDSLGKDD